MGIEEGAGDRLRGLVAMRGFPMDQSQAQVQDFNEDSCVREKNILQMHLPYVMFHSTQWPSLTWD